MKCSTAGVTASGEFICILTVACNEVALLKCSCDPEGLRLLLQHNVSYLKLQKKKITGEGGATDTAPPMEQGPACIRTADRSLGAAMCFMES